MRGSDVDIVLNAIGELRSEGVSAMTVELVTNRTGMLPHKVKMAIGSLTNTGLLTVRPANLQMPSKFSQMRVVLTEEGIRRLDEQFGPSSAATELAVEGPAMAGPSKAQAELDRLVACLRTVLDESRSSLDPARAKLIEAQLTGLIADLESGLNDSSIIAARVDECVEAVRGNAPLVDAVLALIVAAPRT